jgi:hypothetical protein
MGKLERVLGYVRATQEQVMVPCTQTPQNIRAYVDAAFVSFLLVSRLLSYMRENRAKQ